MTILEYIKKEHAKIKQRPKEERLSYFWTYYKWHLLGVLLVLVLLVQGIVSIFTHRDTVFSGYLLNCKIGVDDKAFLSGFYEYAGIDESSQQAAFYSDIVLTDGNSKNDIAAFQRMMAGIATKDSDFIVGQPEGFRLCAYNTNGIFKDLREFLDPATLTQYADRLYYIDGAVFRKLNAPVGEAVEIDPEKFPDPTKPELMDDPIPVGIDISDREAFHNAYYFPDTTLYIGVVTNTPREELVTKLIQYLFL